ncbi:muts domain V-domain-containing protein [Scleroderma citrinum]
MNLQKFPHCILLTRVGQFYESYFDQANEVARLLGIKLTSRVWDKQNVVMCGFPIMHLDKYLKVLVLQHKRFVAMCEEFPHYQTGQKPAFERRVVRVITPGTLIDEPFLNHYENNYLLAIAPESNISDGTEDSHSFGLAWIDVSTGEFFTKTIPSESLKDHLAQICPREIVLPKELKNQLNHPARRAIEDEDIFISYSTQPPSSEPRSFAADNALLEADLPSVTYTTRESEAIDILTSYMGANLLEHMPKLSTPSQEGSEDRMQIDSHTIKALEIRESTREGGLTGSLLSVVKRTVTSSGTRFLVRRLCSPSTSVREIESRQALVEFFYTRPFLCNDVVQMLRECEDASRIVQRFLLSKGEPRDLLSINRTIEIWISIQKRLELERQMETSERGSLIRSEWEGIDALVSGIADLQSLSRRIALALHDIELLDSVEAPSEDDLAQEEKVTQAVTYNGVYKWTVRPEFSDQLTTLHESLNDLLNCRRTMERDLQLSSGAPSLTLRTSPAQGMHVHIARAKRDQGKIKSSSDFVSISENASTSSFFYQPWSQLGNQMVETTTAISNAEKEIFNTLRNEVKAFSTQLRRNARIMDELDVTIGFANLATELRLVRPIIKDDATYEVIDGRHPTVELGLLTSGRVFTPNSISIRPNSRLHIITGPNMAGKSTFLRQTALIAILAQTGSFVPAENAVIGVVDRLFSRVGAKDDLFRDRSTFMVEMLETAEILRRATPRSLVIMDEVGRGTTVRDGLAIAFATVHYLVVHSRCRALFATHFHELADLLAYSKDNHHGDGIFSGVGFFCTDVDETVDDYFTYSHRLRPGVNRDSHGLKVAQLAGMPNSVVLLAKNVLGVLQRQEHMSAADLALLGRSVTTTDG